jgi:hypothetical protein
VLGLALSITLSQLALVALASWLLIARWTGRLLALEIPLPAPLAVFVAWSVIAALASARSLDSVVGCKHLLNLGALIVLVNALPDASLTRRFAAWLVLALTITAVPGLVQVAMCPGPEVTGQAGPLLGRLLRTCARARGPTAST